MSQTKAVKDLTTSLINVLDNADVLEKLTQVLSASIQLTFDERIVTVHQKLDKILEDNKVMAGKISDLEKENSKMKQESNGMQTKIESLQSRVNQLEQAQLCNNVIIHGVKETYAERVDAACTDENPPARSREDTVDTARKLFQDSCGLTVDASDIQAAYRIQSKADGPRPLLVVFKSASIRASVMNARKPKETLKFHGNSIYINEHLTAANADLARRARQLVKDDDAFATWTRNGQIFIKWNAMARPVRVRSVADFD